MKEIHLRVDEKGLCRAEIKGELDIRDVRLFKRTLHLALRRRLRSQKLEKELEKKDIQLNANGKENGNG